MNTEQNNVKIVFVKNLYPYFDAICLFWIDEIHIDERLKNEIYVNDIIKHELTHYKYYKKSQKYLEQGKTLSAILIGLQNACFDLVDSIRIDLKRMFLKWRNKK